MTGEEATVAVIDALESLHVPYMLVGSFASNFYGIPRATQDADFVVQLEKGSLGAIAQRLGPPFRLDPQMSFELVTGTTRHVLQVVDTPFHVELFLLGEDPHDEERFRRRRRVTLLGRETFVPTVEDVIITKLRWSLQGQRRKDVDDVHNVIAVQAERIAWDYVTAWCDRHGTRELLEQIRKSVPPL
jgi:hypothetical protein